MMSRIATLKCGLLAAMLLALAPTVSAEGDAAGYSEEKLQSFVVARADVREIRSDLESRMEQAESDDQEVAQMQIEAQREMVRAVRDQDLTAEEYNEIARKANSDPEFDEQLQELTE